MHPNNKTTTIRTTNNTRSTGNFDHLLACPDCDLLVPRAEPTSGYSQLCPRCGKIISKRNSDSVRKTLVLSITGLLLYLPAILLPLMTMKSFGFSDSANIIDSIINFYQSGYYLVASMVLLSALILPLVLLSSIFLISLKLIRNKYPPYLTKLFRLYLHLEEWAMLEVYLLGIMITIIKMNGSTDISYQSGIFCFTGLVLLTLSIGAAVDNDLFWQAIEYKGKVQPPPAEPVFIDTGKESTARQHGLALCHVCHKLSPAKQEGKDCPRCGQPLHIRNPGAVTRTWALVITSAILLAPANLLPIMRVDFLGIPDRSTIMDGIVYFFQHGSYLIGLIIFTASILVPVFKIVGLIILLRSNRPKPLKILKQKARMYRFISFIGRWSMLDIFVIALLSVLVNFGFFTSIHVAPAATYFCIVVISTMFAVIVYDPRILWDRCRPTQQVSATAPPRTSTEND